MISSTDDLDRPTELCYTSIMKALFQTERNDEKPIEVSFTDRLRFTIAQMEAETQQGLENWTPTITRLKEVLTEEENKISAKKSLAIA